MRAVIEIASPLRRLPPRTTRVRALCIYKPRNPGLWPTFEDDVRGRLRAALGYDLTSDPRLPSMQAVRGAYCGVWASHFEDLLDSDPSISLGEGIRAVLSALIFRGRLGDRRFHPTSAELLALLAVGRCTIYRDRRAALDKASAMRNRFREVWAEDSVLVAPACMYPAPRLGRANYNLHLLSCTMPGNLSDATCLTLPFGTFQGGLPRAIQLMGPPGSEACLLDLAEELMLASNAD